MSGITGLVVPRHIAAQAQGGRTCGTCRWAHRDSDKDMSCRKNPPQATILLAAVSAGLPARPLPFCTFPLVTPDMWCGSWEEKPGTVQ